VTPALNGGPTTPVDDAHGVVKHRPAEPGGGAADEDVDESVRERSDGCCKRGMAATFTERGFVIELRRRP
jgi:hypothetical protein